MKSSLSVLAILPGARKRARRRAKVKPPIWRRWMDAALTWVQAHRPARTPRRLRLCETVSFGEKRFAAVVEFEDRRFLIGGAANSVSLLADLQQVSFANALSQKVSVTQEAK